jgi:chitinase
MVVLRRLALVSALVIGGGFAAGPASAHASTPQQRKPSKVVSAYFADWDVYGRAYHVKDIPADRINVIQYAFGVPGFDPATGTASCNVLDPWADYQQPYTPDISVDGVADDAANLDQHLFGSFNQLRKLKAAHPGLRVEISLGGWTKSTWFADVAATSARRQAFVASCLSTFIKGDLAGGGWPEGAGGPGAAAGVFDGIDLDWEYPTALAGGNVDYGPADRHNATLLAAEFRRQLDALGSTTGKHYLLTAALPAARNSTTYYELASFVRYLDWANVMTYDFNVPGGAVAAPDTLFRADPRDPHASDWTWNTVGTVGWYLAHGVPRDKLVVGVPFYANQYAHATRLYGSFDDSGLDPNTLQWDLTPQPTYHDLVDIAGIISPATSRWDAVAGEPYLVLNSGGIDRVIVYSDPVSVGERTQLISSLGLRGAMAWEISQDSDAHALIGALSPLLH